MSTLLHDLRYALRMLRKNPGFTLLAALTLALGIGANTAMFSVVDAALLRPLPFPQPERMVQLGRAMRGYGMAPWQSLPDYRDIRDQLKGVVDLAAASGGGSATYVSGGASRQLQVTRVTSNFFDVAGEHALLGHGFSAGDEKPGSDVALVSSQFWKQDLGGGRDVIGRSLVLDGKSYAIVGVVPAQPLLTPGVQVFLPLPTVDQHLDRSMHSLIVYGRLEQGWTPAQAQGRLAAVSERLARLYPTADGSVTQKFLNLRRMLVGSIRPALLILLGAVSFVLLIACVNVANMLLARALGRQREIAIRAALGASRAQMMRQLLTESVLLSLLGGALGLILAQFGLQAFLLFRPDSLPQGLAIHLDGRVLAFTLAASLACGILFGLAPALRMTRGDLASSLKDRAGQMMQSRRGLRSLLVSAEVALAMVLLVAAGLLMQSLFNLRNTSPGFESGHMVAMSTVFPRRLTGTQEASDYWMRINRRLEQVPGVRYAAVTNGLPLELNPDMVFVIAGRPVPANLSAAPDALYMIASPGYFHALGLPLRAGRVFDTGDTAAGDPVIVINQALADRYFPHQNPLGQRITMGGPLTPGLSDTAPRRIIGIVGNVADQSVADRNRPAVYIPVAQLAPGVMKMLAGSGMDLVVRLGPGAGNWGALLPRAVHEVDPTLPVQSPQAMDTLVRASLHPQDFNLLLLGGFAGLALLLAALGIYGVMAYAVGQRRQEIGVRMALGARPLDVLQLILRQGMALAGLGIAAGLVLALFLTRLLTSLLFGVSPAAPGVYAMLAVVLALVALAANFVPALRAARVDPMVALREE